MKPSVSHRSTASPEMEALLNLCLRHNPAHRDRDEMLTLVQLYDRHIRWTRDHYGGRPVPMERDAEVWRTMSETARSGAVSPAQDVRRLRQLCHRRDGARVLKAFLNTSLYVQDLLKQRVKRLDPGTSLLQPQIPISGEHFRLLDRSLRGVANDLRRRARRNPDERDTCVENLRMLYTWLRGRPAKGVWWDPCTEQYNRGLYRFVLAVSNIYRLPLLSEKAVDRRPSNRPLKKSVA